MRFLLEFRNRFQWLTNGIKQSSMARKLVVEEFIKAIFLTFSTSFPLRPRVIFLPMAEIDVAIFRHVPVAVAIVEHLRRQ